MTLDDRLDRIAADIARLARADQGREIFGSIGHHYTMGPTLPEQDVVRFEEQHGVRLPEDYRAFLQRVGNGGAGPFYGVFALGDADDGRWMPGELVGRPSAPFPHGAAWNWPEDRIERLADEDGDEADALTNEYFAPLDGALPLATEGCALREWLVVAGPEAGTVWRDARADFAGLHPWGHGASARESGCFTWAPVHFGSRRARAIRPVRGEQTLSRLTFLDWYELWLQQALAAFAN